MSRRPEVIDKATDHVVFYESAVMQMLCNELEQSKHRAEVGCKCPMCQKHVLAIEAMVKRERDRTSTNTQS